MIQDNSRGYRVFRVVNGIVLSLITFAAFYPMYFVVIASFSASSAEPIAMAFSTISRSACMAASLAGSPLIGTSA